MDWLDSGMTTAVKVRGTLDSRRTARGLAGGAEDSLSPGWPRCRRAAKKGERWRIQPLPLRALERRQVEGSFSPLRGDFHALPRFGWLVYE
jgi:hypothetical protein